LLFSGTFNYKNLEQIKDDDAGISFKDSLIEYKSLQRRVNKQSPK